MAGKAGWHQTPEAKEKIRQRQLKRERALRIYETLEAAGVDMEALAQRVEEVTAKSEEAARQERRQQILSLIGNGLQR